MQCGLCGAEGTPNSFRNDRNYFTNGSSFKEYVSFKKWIEAVDYDLSNPHLCLECIYTCANDPKTTAMKYQLMR